MYLLIALYTLFFYIMCIIKPELTMKRTNIVIDEKLVEAGKRVAGVRTTRELVDLALRDLVRRGKQRRILDLKGRIDWQGDLSEMRSVRGRQ